MGSVTSMEAATRSGSSAERLAARIFEPQARHGRQLSRPIATVLSVSPTLRPCHLRARPFLGAANDRITFSGLHLFAERDSPDHRRHRPGKGHPADAPVLSTAGHRPLLHW